MVISSEDQQDELLEALELLIEASNLSSVPTPESINLAINKYLSAAKQFRILGNIQNEVYSLQGLIASYANIGDSESVEIHADRLMELCRKTGDNSSLADTFITIGKVYYFTGDIIRSLQYFEKALPLKESVEDLVGQQEILINIGSCHYYANANQQALEFYHKALAIAQEINSNNGQSHCYHNIASIYDVLGEYEKAIEYYTKSLILEENKDKKDPVNMGTTLYMLGQAYSNLGNINQALILYNKARPLLQESGNKRNEGFLCQNLAATYLYLGEVQKSLGLYEEALKLTITSNNPSGQSLVFTGLGNLYLKLKNYDKALDYYNKGASLSQLIGDIETTFPALLGIAKIYQEKGDLIKAKSVMEGLIKKIESLGNKLDNPKFRGSYLASRHDYYDFYADLLR